MKRGGKMSKEMSKEKKDNTMKARPTTRVPQFLNHAAVQDYICKYYESEGKGNYPMIAIARWKKGTHFPPVEVLIGIAGIMQTNLSYILGLTDEDNACDYSHEPVERTLEDLMNVSGMNEKELVSALSKNYKMVRLFKEELPRKRVYSLIKLANAMQLSVDYILGYTDWKTWEIRPRLEQPFKDISPGTGAYFIVRENVSCAEDISDAIKCGDGQYCLVTLDGKQVIFPNGETFAVDDPRLVGYCAVRVVPEVK